MCILQGNPGTTGPDGFPGDEGLPGVPGPRGRRVSKYEISLSPWHDNNIPMQCISWPEIRERLGQNFVRYHRQNFFGNSAKVYHGILFRTSQCSSKDDKYDRDWDPVISYHNQLTSFFIKYVKRQWPNYICPLLLLQYQIQAWILSGPNKCMNTCITTVPQRGSIIQLKF